MSSQYPGIAAMTRAKKYGIWALVLTPVLLLIGLPFGLHFYLKHRVAAYRAELRQRGELLELKDLIPPLPTNGPNGATEFLLAAGQLQDDYNIYLTINPMKMVAPGRAIVSWRQAEWIGNSGTNEWPLLIRGVADNEKALADIRAATRQPELQFYVDYLQGNQAKLPHSRVCKPVAGELQNSALQALREGNLIEANANMVALWRLIDSMDQDRFLIMHLIRIALLQIFHAQFWEYLEHPGVTDTELLTWQNCWERIDLLSPGEISLKLELAMVESVCVDARRDPTSNGMLTFNPQDWSKPVPAVRDRIRFYLIWPFFASYQTERANLEITSSALHSMRRLTCGTSWLSQRKTLEDMYDSFMSGAMEDGRFNFNPVGIYPLQNSCARFISTETLRRMTITAIALKRYRLKHGQYPMELAALVPEYIKEVPLDPMDAKPLRYRLNPDGTFVLYSIGEDGEDNQGDGSIAEGSGIARYWLKGKDWVWPQPATQEQVNAWFAKQRERARR